MLRHYEVNLAGPSHVRLGIPCQDSCAAAVCDDVVIAAVADGLGSESRSDVGSRVAATTAVAYCEQHLATCESPDDTTAMLRAACYAAYEAVLDEAARLGESPGQMDCTLCLAVFDGRSVSFGQSGDSGLVVAHSDGSYEVVTQMQRDDEGRVFPLCFDDRWEFGRCEDVATVLLCTDGVLEDLIAPPILARHADNPVDTRLARGFLHPALDEGGVEALQADAERYLEAFPAALLDDDKTVVVVFDDERLPADMPPPYYEGPDWDAVCAKANALVREHRAEPDPPQVQAAAEKPAADQPAQPAPAPQTAPAPPTTCRPASAPAAPDASRVAADELRTAAEDALCQLGRGAVAVASVVAEGGAMAAEQINEQINERRRAKKPRKRTKPQGG